MIDPGQIKPINLINFIYRIEDVKLSKKLG
jgi:hypothetical protein